MEKKSFKRIFYTFSVVLSGALTLFLFNNATNFSKEGNESTRVSSSASRNVLSVPRIQAQSLKLKDVYQDPDLSPEAKRLIRKQKTLVSNYLALKILARSCKELLNNDDGLVNGLYKLYPAKDLKKPVTLFCRISGGDVTEQVRVNKKRNIASCAKNNDCLQQSDFYKDYTCESSANNSTKVFCNVGRAFGEPVLKRLTGGRQCYVNDYGFTMEKGLWVRNGCKGVFRMRTFPQIKI